MKAINALTRIDSNQGANSFWKQPYGEPEWVTIPAGEFWKGDGKLFGRTHLSEFRISRVPITNAQYAIFISDSRATPPENWSIEQISKGLENHPMGNVTWYSALDYCMWLGEKLGLSVTLPSEAEWEKAARGGVDKRKYPWGDQWSELYCNSGELELKATTPVGLFLKGESPYGVLDMSGNVWEWTRSNFRTGKDLTMSDKLKVYSEAEVKEMNAFYAEVRLSTSQNSSAVHTASTPNLMINSRAMVSVL